MTLMRKLALGMMATTLVLGITAWPATAQTQQPGASSVHAQLKNVTPIETVACKSRAPTARRAPIGFVVPTVSAAGVRPARIIKD